jgi:hypothetical protein
MLEDDVAVCFERMDKSTKQRSCPLTIQEMMVRRVALRSVRTEDKRRMILIQSKSKELPGPPI